MTCKTTDDGRALVVSIALCQSAGVVGAFFTRSAIPDWYVTLTKPAFTLPAWVFAPVWIVLYALMGIAAFLVWRKGFHHRTVRGALFIFAGQLMLNAAWPVLFFGLRSIEAALVEILLLWIAVCSTVMRFFRVSRQAGWLLVPYLLWTSYAALLNVFFWIMNS